MAIPFYFDVDSRRLFGLYHARSPAAAPRRAVLLCNAFGREAIRAHRLYRVLAERLTRVGCDVLRFDYSCTGDSGGEEIDADVRLWQEDVRGAHAELQRRSGSGPVAWFAMRFGALIARDAAAPARPDRLVLWDPVVDGRDYLDLLRMRHLERRASSPQGPAIEVDVFRRDSNFYMDEAIGFPFSRALCDQMRAARLPMTSPVATRIIVDPESNDGRSLAGMSSELAAGIEVSQIVHGTDWTSNRDASGLVPAPAMNLIIEKIVGE